MQFPNHKRRDAVPDKSRLYLNREKNTLSFSSHLVSSISSPAQVTLPSNTTCQYRKVLPSRRNNNHFVLVINKPHLIEIISTLPVHSGHDRDPNIFEPNCQSKSTKTWELQNNSLAALSPGWQPTRHHHSQTTRPAMRCSINNTAPATSRCRYSL